MGTKISEKKSVGKEYHECGNPNPGNRDVQGSKDNLSGY